MAAWDTGSATVMNEPERVRNYALPETCELCIDRQNESSSCTYDCMASQHCPDCVPCDGDCRLDDQTCSDRVSCCEETEFCCTSAAPICTEPHCAEWDEAICTACTTSDCTLPDCNIAHACPNPHLVPSPHNTSTVFGEMFYPQQAYGMQHFGASVFNMPSTIQSPMSSTLVGHSTSSSAHSCGFSPAQSMISEIDQMSSTSLDPFHCHWNDCDLSFLNSLQFDQHFMLDHLGPLNPHDNGSNGSTLASAATIPLSCAWDHCQTAIPSAPALLNHVKHDHLEVEEHHRCKWLVADLNGTISPCNRCVKTVEELTAHICEDHIGTRQKEYTCYWQDCERCNRPFGQRQKIVRHIVVHTGDRPHRCNICGYTCSEEAVLRQHRRTHTGEKPYKCSICYKSFSASTALSVHMRTHTGFKPLVCKFPGCGKRFGESSNLAKHMRTHCANRPFRCDFPACDKSFQRPDQLKRHRRLVHKEDEHEPDSRRSSSSIDMPVSSGKPTPA